MFTANNKKKLNHKNACMFFELKQDITFPEIREVSLKSTHLVFGSETIVNYPHY